MTYLRLPYDDASTTTDMAVDCAEVGRTMRVEPFRRPLGARPFSGAAGTTPVVPDDLAELAAGMQLHLD